MKQYPKWLFHKSHEPKVVKSPEEHDALGAQWKESPAEFGIETHPQKSGAAEAAKTAVEAPEDKKSFSEMTELEAYELALKSGIPKKALKGKSKEEVLQMIEVL